MFLKACPGYKGKIYLSFVQGYRDEFGNSKQKTIEKLGYLEDLKNMYDDPIAHFKEVAKQRNAELMSEYTIKNLNTQTIELNSKPKNLGYAVLKKIYKELGLDETLKEEQSKYKIEYNLSDILPFLVYMRVLKPGSKKDNYENKDLLFENTDFSLDDIYRSLTILSPLKEKIQQVMWEHTKNKYKRNTSNCYYDCTNYYFEVEYNDEDEYELDSDGHIIKDEKGEPVLMKPGLRKRGPEKNHRPDPIVEMGLLMDSSDIPLAYDLFPGNESEKKSLIPILKRTKADFDLGRTIIVADRGLNTSDNIIHIAGTSIEQSKKLNGYVYGQSVRGADEEFKAWVLEQDYKTDVLIDDNAEEVTFIHKSRVYPKKMRIVRDDKGKTKNGNDKVQYITVDQKQMVYYSQKYADKQKRDREKIVAKARDLMSHPDRYTKATSYGVAGYINNLKFVKSTGEVANAYELTLNEERIKEEEKYDGYYSIVTSEEHLSDIEIRRIYRGLSRIEETFKVTKSGLSGRPVWVSLEEHIQSHFLTCFIALVIVRLLEKRLNNKYNFQAIINAIRNYTSCNIDHDIYLHSFRNEVIDSFEQEFNIELSKKFKNLSEIKKILK